ncbi:DUF1080 domain-containing protein [Novosphingobium sp. SG916]|uniref:3-keto-disaccharide hydrolase n=2 Tax=unclassified Novosphingobium TaxID=2644732 RepID=UPI00146F292C|nr:DUF1080 domain-containing protein [Novosphingobium sp. SG916]NMN04683.1 hypothetical protein [Novosphingobium sp. SG919]
MFRSHRLRSVAPLALGLAQIAASPPAAAQSMAPDGSTPEQQAIVAKDKPFRAQPLTLVSIPKPAGRRIALFNGRNLDGWDSWLGVPQPMMTYAFTKDRPIGLNRDATGVFSVVQEDGRPALRVSGKIFGALITKGDYHAYHLHAEFKWGTWQLGTIPRNNGILYHAHGQQGSFLKTWSPSIEFELVPQHFGMLLTPGDSSKATSFNDIFWNVSARSTVGSDRTIPYPWRRFMPDGTPAEVGNVAFDVDAASDAERPLGQWNTIDLYVVGDAAVHVVNGVPVLAATGMRTRATPGSPAQPLTHGRIQLQSEGAEAFFRNVTIEPIRHLPRVIAKR